MKAKVQWESMKRKSYLMFHFMGDFSTTDAQETINEAQNLMKTSLEPVRMVWDCRGMKRYETGAREAWQESGGGQGYGRPGSPHRSSCGVLSKTPQSILTTSPISTRPLVVRIRDITI